MTSVYHDSLGPAARWRPRHPSAVVTSRGSQPPTFAVAFVDQGNYEDGWSDPEVRKALETNKETVESTKAFIANELQTKQDRDDYRAFLELVLIFLGGTQGRGVKFPKPGPVHHARWMAKCLYSLYIFLFRKQFRLTAREATTIREFSLFCSLVYCRVWFQAPSLTDAPSNDLRLLQDLNAFRTTSEIVAKAALTAFKRHLWYLTPQMIPLSLFSDNVDPSEKSSIVRAMEGDVDRGIVRNARRLNIEGKRTPQSLSELADVTSSRFFDVVGLDKTFLGKDPVTWKEDEAFKSGLHTLQGMKPINDVAERGVKLIEDYNESITKKEDQKQFLLQQISEHRRNFPDPKKGTVVTKK